MVSIVTVSFAKPTVLLVFTDNAENVSQDITFLLKINALGLTFS